MGTNVPLRMWDKHQTARHALNRIQVLAGDDDSDEELNPPSLLFIFYFFFWKNHEEVDVRHPRRPPQTPAHPNVSGNGRVSVAVGLLWPRPQFFQDERTETETASVVWANPANSS